MIINAYRYLLCDCDSVWSEVRSQKQYMEDDTLVTLGQCERVQSDVVTLRSDWAETLARTVTFLDTKLFSFSMFRPSAAVQAMECLVLINAPIGYQYLSGRSRKKKH